MQNDQRNKFFRNPEICNEINELLAQMGSGSHFSIGNDLVIFRKLFISSSNHSERLKRVIDYAREISGTLSLARLLRIPGYTLPSWYSNETPVIDVKELRHPMLENRAVPNDIRLSKNLLITGPNQAGKSTFMRALLLASWMAQTVGIVRVKVKCNAIRFNLFLYWFNGRDWLGKLVSSRNECSIWLSTGFTEG